LPHVESVVECDKEECLVMVDHLDTVVPHPV